MLKEEIEVLNYVELISSQHKDEFQTLHNSPWDKTIQISDFFKERLDGR